MNVHVDHSMFYHVSGGTSGTMARVRQNSLFVNSTTSLLSASGEPPRRCHSAFDLQSMTNSYGSDICGGYRNATNVTVVPQTDEDHDIMRTVRPVSETSRLLQRERRSSTTYQFDRMNVLAHPMASLRERGMSICHFDRREVLARPQQRDRGMSISQFDKMEVLARPQQRDRRMSICQFDKMEVLARSQQRDRGMSISQFDKIEVLTRPQQRDRGMSICQFDKMEVLARPQQRDRRMSICQFDKMDVLARPQQRDRRMSICQFDKMEVLARTQQRDRGMSICQLDRMLQAPPSVASESLPLSRETCVSVCDCLDNKLAHSCGISTASFHRQDRRFSTSNISDTARALALGKDHCRSIDVVQITSTDSKRTDTVAKCAKICRDGDYKPHCRAKCSNANFGHKVSRV